MASAQTSSVDRKQFFNDTSIITATITSNMSKLFGYNKQGVILPGQFSAMLPDGTNVNEPIQMQIRGHFRHGYCYIPPVKLICNANKSSVISSLKSLKLVSECKLPKQYEQYLLKEYLTYRIFNLVTDMSFKVRLLRMNFQDSLGKKKTISEYAFLLEDIKDVAKRNKCTEWKGVNLSTELINRKQMTVVAIFQYMIGNTDWAVSVNHNIRIIYSIKDSAIKIPYAVPYDFDYCGLVNTEYAVPDEKLEIENVRQRVYRGFPRTMAELNQALSTFIDKKEKIYATINDCSLLTALSKKEMTNYLDEFYDQIKSQNDVKSVFIENARTQ
jgi:hypothetical protein